MSIDSIKDQIKALEKEESKLFQELGDQEAGLALRSFSVIMRDLDEMENKIAQLKETLESYEGGV